MSTEQAPQKDKFWLYVGFTLFLVLTGILMVKLSENDKYASIKQQLDEESAQMNIRVLN